MRILPAQKYLAECFTYDKNTGLLTWQVRRPAEHFKDTRGMAVYKRVCSGRSAGSINIKTGRLSNVSIAGKAFAVHRIIWKLIYGYDSTKFIDHIDRNPLNNRLDNLREATAAENMHNRSINKNNSTGFKGVTYDKFKKKWCAKIYINCSAKWLGFFESPEKAHEAYCAEAKKLFGAFSSEK